MNQQQIVFQKVYATLLSLKNNIPNWSVEEKYAYNFNESLDKLKNLGIDIDEFKISNSEIKREVSCINVDYLNDKSNVSYTEERYVDHNYFMLQIDKVLTFLQSILQVEPPEEKIWFKLE